MCYRLSLVTVTIFACSYINAQQSKLDTTVWPQYQNRLQEVPYGNIAVGFQEACILPMATVLYEMKDKKNLFNTFGVTAQKILTPIQFNNDSLVNGKMCMQFFSAESDTLPKGFFWGNFKNGYANGYGVYVERYTQKEGTRFWYKKGFWKNGIFVHNDEADNLINWAESRIDYQTFFNIGEVTDKRIVPIAINFKRDVLNANLPDGAELQFMVRFNSVNPHWAIFGVYRPDFMSQDTIVMYDGDTFLKRRYDGYQALLEWNSMLGAAIGSIKTGITGEKEYNEYTKLYLDPWYQLSSTDCRDNDEHLNDPYNNYSSYGDFALERYRDVTVYFRKDASSSYKKSGTETLYKRELCGGGQYYYLKDKPRASAGESLLLNAFRFNEGQTFSSENEAYDFIVRESGKSSAEYDSAKSKIENAEQDKYDRKVSLLFDRIATSNEFKFITGDTLSGAWYSSANNRIIFKYPNSNNLFYLSLDEETLFYIGGYQKKITTHNAKTISRSKIFFSEIYNDGTGLRTNEYSKDIATITKDQITFYDRDVWQRIVSKN